MVAPAKHRIWTIPPNRDPVWPPFGGTVDSPAIPYQSGIQYTGLGFQNNHSRSLSAIAP
jgi:hypothetical protein